MLSLFSSIFINKLVGLANSHRNPNVLSFFSAPFPLISRLPGKHWLVRRVCFYKIFYALLYHEPP